MASKKEDFNNGHADKAESEAERGGERASRQAAARGGEETLARTADTGRQATESSAHLADREIRHATDMTKQASEQARAFMNASTQGWSEIADRTRPNAEVLMQVGTKMARGWQEMGMQMVNLTQDLTHRWMELTGKVAECRNIEDVMTVQRDFIKETTASVMNSSANLFRLSGRLSSDVIGTGEKLGRTAMAQGEQAANLVEGEMKRGRDPDIGREMRH